jgi:hypothetical protein
MTILTNAGRALITAALAAGTAKYTGWGTGTTAEAATQTALVAEVNGAGSAGTNRGSGGTQSQVTGSVTNDTYQVVQTLAATASVTVAEIGVFDAASSGNMLLRSTFTGIPLGNGDSLTLTNQLKFT